MARSIIACVLSAGVVLGGATAVPASDEVSGRWSVLFPSFGDGVTLELTAERGGHKVTSRVTFDEDDLEGLQRSELAHARSLEFRWVHDGGTVSFTGRGRWVRASGEFTFEPDAAFVERLASLGFRKIEAFDILRLALHEVDLQ